MRGHELRRMSALGVAVLSRECGLPKRIPQALNFALRSIGKKCLGMLKLQLVRFSFFFSGYTTVAMCQNKEYNKSNHIPQKPIFALRSTGGKCLDMLEP
jgi:hypothetical protein